MSDAIDLIGQHVTVMRPTGLTTGPVLGVIITRPEAEAAGIDPNQCGVYVIDPADLDNQENQR